MSAVLPLSNREWVFKTRPGPNGFVPTDFELRPCPVPEVGEGQLLVSLHLLSMDPTMRNAMAGSEATKRKEGCTYHEWMNWQPGTVPTWRVVAQIVQSRAEGFEKGELVFAMAPWRELACIDAVGVDKIPEGITASAAMSVTGMTAMTGYLGAKHIGEPKVGDVAFVSGAAGATGLIACQTLKALGCQVFGSAGSDDKVQLLQSIGVGAFNYKKESMFEGIRRLCPNGLNVAFDNVGGETLEAILDMMNDDGRVVLCGAISQYETQVDKRYGVTNLFQAVAKRLKLQGFIVSLSFTDNQKAECQATLTSWLKDGLLKDISTFVDGFENMPQGILGLFAGTNTGKMLVRVSLRDL